MHAPVQESVARAAAGGTAVSEFAVTGMNCNNCARHVSEAIQSVPGVTSAVVRLEEGRATVRWQPGALAQPENIVRAVKEAGYEAAPIFEKTCHAQPSGSSPVAARQFTVMFIVRWLAPPSDGERSDDCLLDRP